MPTRFKLDENLPRDAEVLLQQAGHDVQTVLAEQLGGNPDPRVFDASQAEERVLVTLDLDFSEGEKRCQEQFPGDERKRFQEPLNVLCSIPEEWEP